MELLGRVVVYVVQAILQYLGQRTELFVAAPTTTAVKQALLVLTETLSAEVVLGFFIVGALCVAGCCFMVGVTVAALVLCTVWCSCLGSWRATRASWRCVRRLGRRVYSCYDAWQSRRRIVVMRGTSPIPDGEEPRRRSRRTQQVRFGEGNALVAVRGPAIPRAVRRASDSE